MSRRLASRSLPTELLEREQLLSRARALLERARSGSGGVVLFEGSAGVGKTSLLQAIADQAEGLLVARARPVELERAFAFGVLRGLFDSLLARRPPAQRRRLLTGPGAAAPRVLADMPEEGHVPVDVSHAAFYGLFWVLSLVAADDPVLLMVDDAHWADEASLAWFSYLAARVKELPVAVILAARVEPARDALAELAVADGVTVESVPPLSGPAVEKLVARALGSDTASRVAEAAASATGGNPFLLGELLRAWRESGAPGSLATTTRLRRQIWHRVERAHPNAGSVAQAVAVLGGEHVPIAATAALADLRSSQTLQAAEALSRAGILRGGEALSFAHPLVREAVYEALDAVRRAAAHRRAARILHELTEDEDAVAAQLLLAAPTADPWSVAVLRSAARHAVLRGAPELAVRLLRRALAEPPAPSERAEVLHELGEAQARANDPQAEQTLRAALRAASGGRSAEIALSLGRLVMRSGRGLEAGQILADALDCARAESRELALRIQAETFAAARTEPGAALTPPGTLRDDHPELSGSTPAERLLLASLTFQAAVGNAPADVIASLGERALAGGRLVREEGSESLILYFALAALGYIDRYAAALKGLDAALEQARRDGSGAGYALARAFRADVLLRAGALSEAQADALDALALAGEHEVAIAIPLALWPLVLCHVDADRLAEAEALLTSHGFSGEIPRAGLFAGVQYARGRLHMAAGRVEQAYSDFLAVGEAWQGAHVRMPAIAPWRSDAGLALAALGRVEDGRGLVDEEEALARALGAPRALGLALRAQALLDPTSGRIATLEAAAASLRTAGSMIELARVLADLGLAQLRAGERARGRALLREALDLADRQCAHAIAERARQELIVAGGRPRRRRLSGRDALTPAELRVAELAAAGRSNREIATELFLAPKTIETHLSRAYSKLSITSRRELQAALGQSR